jgi:hypothetical protein
MRLIIRHKPSEYYESSHLDSNLILTNHSLSLPLYKSSRQGKIQGKVQVSSFNLSGQTTCNGSDLSDSCSFKSSPFSSSVDESPSNKTTILQLSEAINSELKTSVITLRQLLEVEKNAKENLAKEVQRLKNEQIIQKDELFKREKKVLSDLQSNEVSLSELKFELLKIKTENKALTAENSRISTILKEKEKNFGKKSEDLNFPQVFVGSAGFVPAQIVNDLEKKEMIIRELSKEVNELKLLNKSILLNRQMQKNNDLDELLNQKMKNLKMESLITKDPEQSYFCNGKKIVLVARAGHILCKYGNSFKGFDDYLKSIGINTRSISHKRIRSVDFQNELNKISN